VCGTGKVYMGFGWGDLRDGNHLENLGIDGNGLPGTDSYPSHGPGLAHQPPHGNTSAPAKHQALKTKMDIR